MSRILVVDEEESARLSLAHLLEERGYEALVANDADAALTLLSACPPDLIVCSLQTPDPSSLDALRLVRRSHPGLPVIIMTAHGTTEMVIEATKLGAFDYLLAPLAPAELLQSVERGLESVHLMKKHVAIDPVAVPVAGDAIIGQSAGMQELYKSIGRVAATGASVLIRGETGTGKELVARAIYQHSTRRHLPLLTVNCVAIPETLLESELFGHEKGAFTGANTQRIGKFEQADGSTLFLDEIGDVPLLTQAKLLRVLQDRCFDRLGGNENVRVDVRILAATNRNLEAAIAAGAFREDLYHRLNVVTVTIPPLRARRDDIPSLTDYFLNRFATKLRVRQPPLSEEARQALYSYHWPGNVRELEHCIHRAMIFTRGYPIQRGDVLQALERSMGDTNGQPAVGAAEPPIRVGMTLEEVEREFIRMTLAVSEGNKKECAKTLGISRRALYDKLKRYGLM